MELEHKNILILGLKKSGTAALNFLQYLNVKLYITDENIKVEHPRAAYIAYDRVSYCLKGIDLIIKSPGIPYDIPILENARKLNIKIINDVELAYQVMDNSKVIVGITGSNGKTTTTHLVTAVLNYSSIHAQSVGNVGYSLLDAVREDRNDVYVTELSSFQLLDIDTFRADINVFLNITEAHIDYHHTFDHYLNAKLNLLRNAANTTKIIYNADDPILSKYLEKLPGEKYTFSIETNKADAYLEQGELKYRGEPIIHCHEIKLLGKHNLSNILAAILVGKLFYLEDRQIAAAIAGFPGLPHRLEIVREINGVKYINDSKATNVASTICALDAVTLPVVLLLGGSERNQDFTPIMRHPNLKTIVAYGSTAPRIKSLADSCQIPCIMTKSLEEAMINAHENAASGEIVLLSPASASWDQFESYEKRGNLFKETVLKLE